MENTQLTQNEEDNLLKLLCYLKETHSSKSNEDLHKAEDELGSMLYNIKSTIKLIIKGLSIPKIKNIDISLDLHKSLLVYLKNLLIINQKSINESDYYEFFISIFNLMLTITKNENLQSETMILIFNNLIKTIIDNNDSFANKIYVEKIFELVLNKISSAPKEYCLYIIKNGLGIIFCFLSSQNIGQQLFLDLIQKYLILISDYIFSKINLYIIPNNNIYDSDFIDILINLYDTFYMCLFKLKRFFSSLKRKEIADEFFKKYGKFTYELIQVVPLNNEKMKNKFGDENPIVVFNSDDENINNMKSKAFEFMTIIIQYSTLSSYNNEENKNDININSNYYKDLYDNNYKMDNQELVDITSKIITLIIKTFENILNDDKKFYFLRNIDDLTSDEENYTNILLYDITNFLAESLFKEPIKSEFYPHIKLFLLNVLFPILITIESEKNYMLNNPDEYCAYFNNLLYKQSLKNFRMAGLILIKKISEEFIDISNFILSYVIGMINDIMNKDKNQDININNMNNTLSSQYNAYSIYKSQNVLIDKLNEEIKLDFCLLIIILLQNQLLKYDILRNKLKEVFINAKDKFTQIKDTLIKIKFCHVFKFIIPKFFNDDKPQDEEDQKNNNIIISNNSNIINSSFIDELLSFLFKNLIQLKSEDFLVDGLYYDSLGNEASDIIVYLCKYAKDDNRNSFLSNEMNNLFQKYFTSLTDLISITSLYSFLNVIEQIIKEVKIDKRNDVFCCLRMLTNRYEREYENGDINSQIYCPKYFSIISSFVTGVNRINLFGLNKNDSKSELDLFNKIIEPVLDKMNNIFSFLYYENLVKAMVNYIKTFKGINEQSLLVLQSILNIIENERTFSETSYSYVSTFLFYMQNNISEKDIDEDEIFKLIIEIIEKAFEICPDNYDFSNLYALLLTLQIYTKNMNISDKAAKTLLSKSLKCFNYILLRYEKDGTLKDKKEKDILIFGILALGYIFKPDQTNNLLGELEIIIKKEVVKLYEDEEFEKFDFNKYINILSYINELNIENHLLRKCLILGFCSILKIDKINQYLNNNKNLKVQLLKIFSNFILLHKSEDIKKKNKLIKDELNQKNEHRDYDDYEDEYEDEEDEEEEEEKENKFDKELNYILEINENIKNSDEYTFFKDTLDTVKLNDIESINMLYKELTPEQVKELEEVYHAKKFKINYQGKDLEISRRILNIKRNVN